MCRTAANKPASNVRISPGEDYIIRRSSILSFILLSLALAVTSCQQPQGASHSDDSAGRPLRTPELVTNRPKIVAFGDSLTAGFGLTERESYPYLLQERLKADGYDYEVINAGVSGDTSLGGLERIDWVLEQENVQILILELGANDLLRGAPVAQMRSNLDQMIRKAKAKNIKVLLCGMLAPSGGDYQRQFTSVFPDLAHEHKTGFVPFVLENIALKSELNQADGIHPNAEGAKMMTENIYRELKKML